MNERQIRLLAGAIVLISFSVGLLATIPHHPEVSVSKTLETCSQGNPADLIICTRSQIKALLTEHSTKELLENISGGTLPSAYGGCHSISHLIGEETYKKTGVVETALAQCTNACINGCIHGVVGAAIEHDLGAQSSNIDIAHASFETIEHVGARYCTNNLGLCHGVGHILYIAAHSYQKALAGCDSVAKGYLNEVCKQGVFMQGLGGIGLALVVGDAPPQVAKPVSDNYAYPCNTLSGQKNHACFQYLPEFQELLFSEKGIEDLHQRLAIGIKTCTQFSGRARTDCFEGIGRDMADSDKGVYAATTAEGADACGTMPTQRDIHACIIGRAFIFKQLGFKARALTYCASLIQETRTICYNAYFELTGTNALQSAETLCTDAKSPDACLAAWRHYDAIQKTLPDYRFGLFGE